MNGFPIEGHKMQELMTDYKIYVVFFVVVIFCLAIYLGFLLGKLKQQQLRQRKNNENFQKEITKQLEQHRESLRIISLALIQGQCEIAEGVIRIKKVMEYFPENFFEKEIGDFFNQAYEEFKEFSILNDRKKLTKNDRFQEDKKRFQKENDLHDQVMEYGQKLQSNLNLLS
jgi:hypothetical protein